MEMASCILNYRLNGSQWVGTDIFMFDLGIFLESIWNNCSLFRHQLFTFIGAQTKFIDKWWVSFILRVCFNLSNYDVPMGIYDIFNLILSVLSLHFYFKYFMYRRVWESYKWLENFIIVGSYIGVFIIVLILGCIGLIIVPTTAFGKITFVFLLVVSYFTYYIACTTYWFDDYSYSGCYTSTVILKDRKYLIVSNLATRWHITKIKKITQKEEEIVPSTPRPQDPRLKKHISVNKGLNNLHNKFTSLKTSRSLDGEDEYLQSTRILRPDTCYDQLDTSAWGKSELNEYSNKFRQYKLIPMTV